jgi:phosphotransacetylase
MDLIENRTFDEIAIGDTATVEHVLSLQDLQLFAAVSGNISPYHIDEEFARHSLYQGVVGPGGWATSLLSGLLGTRLPGPGPFFHSLSLRYIVVRAPTEKVRRPMVLAPKVEIVDPQRRFRTLLALTAQQPPVRTAVVQPCDAVSLSGALHTAQEKLIIPVLVGPPEQIHSIARAENLDLSGIEIVEVPHAVAAAEKSVELARTGKVQMIMKGALHTDELMRVVVSREGGLRTARRITHVFAMDVPTYDKPLFITDAAINIQPDLTTKVDIVQNAIDLVHILGIKVPKVALLSAVETVNPAIPSTLEAAALCKMADRGQITGAILDGPLAFDNAISAEAARIKKISSPVSGVVDILVVPDLESGNMLFKQLCYLANAIAAGVVLGARVPVVVTSRADGEAARLASCALGMLVANHKAAGGVK